MLYGYKGFLLRIDLAKKNVKKEVIPKEWFKKYLGGRGIAARIYYDEVKPETGPLSPENKLIFMTGPLTGIPVFCGAKTSLAAKSPLTGIYLCSNASGFFGAQLKFAGYDGLVIDGRAKEPTYISIRDDEVTLEKAGDIWGETIAETREDVREDVGDDKASVVAIGPSGEKLVRFACIICDHRSFGRGGAGAVMGSKNLKAIVVRGTGKVEVADRENMKRKLRASVDMLRETTANHTKYGMSQYTEVIYETGSYPIMNFTRTRIEGGVAEISARVMRERYLIKDTRCFGCPVACGKLCEAKEGRFSGAQAELDYETVWSMGAQCGVIDLNPIIAANEVCDQYGIDAITAGYVIGFAMHLFEEKILTKRDTDGLSLKFGNAEALVDLALKIAKRDGFGDVLAEGAKRAAQRIGGNAGYYVMHVKGMEFPGYEPRAFHGIGLSFATSSRGACHNVGGWTIRAELIKKEYDRFSVEGKGRLVKTIQDVRGYIDSIGICTVSRRALGLTDKPDPSVLNYVTGMNFNDQLLSIGERVYTLERMILNREGITRADDMLPERVLTEPIPDGPAKGHLITQKMLDEMLDEYYRVRGWNTSGIVTAEKVAELGLPYGKRLI